VLGAGRGATLDLAPLLAMHSALSHRGPDAEGFLLLDARLRATALERLPDTPNKETLGTRFAAAFRWLKIRDLRAELRQPQPSPDGRQWLLFNGEVYNWRELREELIRLGHRFRTNNDSEVVLAAYREWQLDSFRRMNGMWAVLIFDLERGKLVGCRDRLGIKPLFYSVDGKNLLFASEPKAIAAARRNGPEIEPFRFHEFLRGLPPQSAELSFFRHVHPVPAGHFFELDLLEPELREPMFRSFWDLASIRSDPTTAPPFHEAQERFESLLFSAVRSHIEAEVPVGSLLSGGLDSSTLTALMARNSLVNDGRAKAFSIIFEDPDMNEWPYIQLVLAQRGLQGHSFLLTADAAWRSIDPVICAQGRPLLGHDMIAQYHAYRLAREHGVVVVLDGQGGDELLAGLPYYESQMFPEMLRKGQFVRLAKEVRLRSLKYGTSFLSALQTYLLSPIRRRMKDVWGSPRYSWMAPADAACDSTRFGRGRTNDWGRDSSALNRFLYRHVRHTNLPAILLQQDHSSMFHSVESRVPFLDHRLVEHCFSLPDSYKVRNGDRKKLLLETARKYLPSSVVNRKDKRMFISNPRWINLRRHAAGVRAMLNSETMRQSPYLLVGPMNRFVEDYLRGAHHDVLAVWRLYTAWRWMETFRLS
jgi:asparagine synthase (glutamine-hydrolysing)